MVTPEQQAAIEQYQPLISAELRRIGVSEEDERWIHGGSGGPLPISLEPMLSAHLAELQELPTGLGVVGYCAHLGFDYATAKELLFGAHPGAPD